MPKLPGISGSDCVSVLKRLGFAQVRQRGSHVICGVAHRDASFPMHRELKVGTLAGVLRQAAVDADELSKHGEAKRSHPSQISDASQIRPAMPPTCHPAKPAIPGKP